MTENDKKFIGHAVLECTKKGVKVLFDHKELIKADGTECAGYFDEENKELHVATKKAQRDFFPIFVHEFCHFQQWIEKVKVYTKVSKGNKIDLDLWDWLNGKDIPIDRVKKSVRAYQEMELDCEKRAIELINEFNLSIEKNNYIQNANIYVLFYSLLLETRKWYIIPPYQIKGIIDIIPTTFIKNFRVPKEYRRIVLEECF